MYKLIKTNPTWTCVQNQNGEIWTTIPFDPANTDYQVYLKWVSEGNTPEPADE